MSLVEWCERQSDPYETTNSISNVAFFIAHAYAPETKSCWLISVVGIGSFYFHVSGSYLGELIDELAMSLLAYFYFVDVYGPSTTYAALTAVVWILYVTLGAYSIFVTFFLLQILVPVYIVAFHTQKTPQQKMDLLKARVCIFVAVYCWGNERYLYANGLCPVDVADPRYYLHSYWHIGTALAHYHFMLVINPRLQLQNTVSVR
jgi:hypothetical protein